MRLGTVVKRHVAAMLSLFIALPYGAPQAHMVTAGAFRVSEMGAASYEIPIMVPPGTAGVAPKLSLAYGSQTGNGLVGVGWSLSGLSAITRCPRTVAQDGVRGGVLFDYNDRYCLDGQRLIVLTAGTDGWAGSEYRAERDSFTKVTAVGTAGNGPTSFVVQTKSGQIIEYGNTADSKAEAQGTTDVRVYDVNKIMDTLGNYLTVTCIDDQVNGDHYPTRIDYTGNTGSVPALVPNQSARFVYETRPDIVPHYQSGSLVRNTVRLKNVQTYVGAAMVMDYRIAYETSPQTSRSRVTSITECPPVGNCLPATSVAWSAPAMSFGTDTSWGVRTDTLNQNGYGTKLYDMNGDGLADFIYDGNAGVQVKTNTGTSFAADANWGARQDSYTQQAKVSAFQT